MKSKKNYLPISKCYKKSIKKYNKCIFLNKCKVDKCEQKCWKIGKNEYEKCEIHLTKIEKLFNAVKHASIQYRMKGNKNGQDFWKPIKEHLSQKPIPESKWKYIGKHIGNLILTFPEYTPNGKIIENNHFLIQQIRIPKTSPLCSRKVIQIALNIGQFIGSDTQQLKKKIKYNSFNCTELSRYVYSRDLVKLSETISDENYNFIMKYLSKYTN